MLTRPAAAARRGVGGGLGAGRARVRVVEVVAARGEALGIMVQLEVLMMLPRHDALEAVVVAQQEGGPHLVQYSTVQYSTVQYSTAQYSTVQYSTVQYSVCTGGRGGRGSYRQTRARPHPRTTRGQLQVPAVLCRLTL